MTKENLDAINQINTNMVWLNEQLRKIKMARLKYAEPYIGYYDTGYNGGQRSIELSEGIRKDLLDYMENRYMRDLAESTAQFESIQIINHLKVGGRNS